MSTPGELLINAFNQGISTGQGFALQRQKNAIRNILAQNYQAPVAPMSKPVGIPNYPGESNILPAGMPNLVPNLIVPNLSGKPPSNTPYLVPNYDPVGKPGGFNMQNAIAQMYQQGLGPEAMQLQQTQSAQDLQRMMTEAQIAKLQKAKLSNPMAGQVGNQDTFFRTDDQGHTFDLSGNPLSGVVPRPQRPLVNINQNQESAESKTIGAGFGKDYLTIQKGALDAQNKLNTLNRLNQLLEGVNTGKLSPLKTDLAAYGQALGFKVDPKIGNMQAAQSITNEMAMQLRNPAGGAGMPGAMSDKDREFLQSIPPGIEKTPEGRRLITESMQKIAQRDIDVARIARDYRAKHGHVDEGLYTALQNYSNTHPLFQSMQLPQGGQQQSITATNPRTGEKIIFKDGTWQPLR